MTALYSAILYKKDMVKGLHCPQLCYYIHIVKRNRKNDMRTYNILVETGYTFEFDCQIVAKSPQAARKIWYARNNMQTWRTIKATKAN